MTTLTPTQAYRKVAPMIHKAAWEAARSYPELEKEDCLAECQLEFAKGLSNWNPKLGGITTRTYTKMLAAKDSLKRKALDKRGLLSKQGMRPFKCACGAFVLKRGEDCPTCFSKSHGVDVVMEPMRLRSYCEFEESVCPSEDEGQLDLELLSELEMLEPLERMTYQSIFMGCEPPSVRKRASKVASAIVKRRVTEVIQ